jgi:hypothetical protein
MTFNNARMKSNSYFYFYHQPKIIPFKCVMCE